MSTAYRCDKCGELFEWCVQRFELDFEDENTCARMLKVDVGSDRDYCPKCVVWALKEAIKQVK